MDKCDLIQSSTYYNESIFHLFPQSPAPILSMELSTKRVGPPAVSSLNVSVFYLFLINHRRFY